MAAKHPRSDFSALIEWDLPSKPFHLQASRAVLGGMQLSAQQSLAKQPHLRPGGLLLGQCVGTTVWNISVDRHFPIEWDASRGGAPFLTDAQRQAIHKMLAASSSDLKIVGYYRAASPAQDPSQRADFLIDGALAEGDRALMAGCVLAPVAAGICLEGRNLAPRSFVLWEDGKIYDLSPQSTGMLGTRTRAVTPVLIRDEQSVRPMVPRPRYEEQVHARSDDPAGEPESERKASFRPALSVWLIAGMVVTSVLTYIAAHIWLKPFLTDVAARVGVRSEVGVTDTTPSASTLGLKVIPSGTALDVSWNRLSPAILAAHSGRLVIVDGPLNRQIDLDRDQLRNGRVVYGRPLLGDVTLRLEVMDSSSHSVGESVRITGGSFAGVSVPGQNTTAEAGNLAPNDIPGHEIVPPGDMSTLSPLDQPISRKKHTPAATSQSMKRPASALTREGASGATNRDLNRLSTKDAHDDTQAEQTGLDEKSHSAPAAISTPFLQGTMLSSAANNYWPDTTNAGKLLTLPTVVRPYYPAVRRGAPVLEKDVFVPVTVKINERGEVISAALTHPDQSALGYYADQAVNAARAWRFSPARINGKPVVWEMEIQIHFQPSK